MRSLVVRRASLAASAAALAVLATACGGSSGSGDKGGDGKTAQADKTASAAPSQTVSAGPAAAKALSAAELEKAALTQADVKSGKLVTKVPAQDDIAQSKAKTDEAACAPLAYLQVGTYVGTPSATVKREWTGDARKPAAGASAEDTAFAALNRAKVLVTLASYEDGGAAKAFADLRTASTKCAGGFAFTVGSDKTKVDKVAVTAPPQGADEALALTSLVDADEGIKAPVKGVVVRKGATLAYFPAVNLAAAATGKDFDFPTEIVEAQLAKLG
ncbi:hypothetical protein ACFYZE_14910 [Streptomyces sp. NPDC001796]|uniref:hypothetical protein n=1 Tax=Streptomyces sp. NPDC001796 TaxID=3364609 RepID=UPI0036A8E16D